MGIYVQVFCFVCLMLVCMCCSRHCPSVCDYKWKILDFLSLLNDASIKCLPLVAAESTARAYRDHSRKWRSFTLFVYLYYQDEFRRWFLARVRVMLAPGSNPFYSLETQTTFPPSPSSPNCPFSSLASSSLANGHTPHPSDGSTAQELIRRFADYQPTQVGTPYHIKQCLDMHTHTLKAYWQPKTDCHYGNDLSVYNFQSWYKGCFFSFISNYAL